MYIVHKTLGLIWQPSAQPSEKSGWDEINHVIRDQKLYTRTSILCEPNPNWFGRDFEPRTEGAQFTAWNVLVELCQLEVLEKGYYAFVSPTLLQGFKFEIIGWKDVVHIIITNEGDISWRVYRDSLQENKDLALLYQGDTGENQGDEGERVIRVSESCQRIGHGYIQGNSFDKHPLAGTRLRKKLKELLIPYQSDSN